MALPIKNFICQDYNLFSQVCLRMGMDPIFAIETLHFGAGTMFIARSSALLPLSSIGYTESTFALEGNQTANTFAHAIERAIAVSVFQSGYTYSEVETISSIGNDFFNIC